MSAAIHKYKERMRDGGPEEYDEVVKKLQGRTCQGKLENAVTKIHTNSGNTVVLADMTTRF